MFLVDFRVYITFLWFCFGFCGIRISSMYFDGILFDCSNYQADLGNSV